MSAELVLEMQRREQGYLSELADYGRTVQRLNRTVKALQEELDRVDGKPFSRLSMTSPHVAAATADICELVHESCTGATAYLIRERIKGCVAAERAEEAWRTGVDNASPERPKL